ncbi:MAG: hypothetical protein P1P87_04855, partial [Trueperaceae bacterium]|nr:hypothetical protein [Trueperaceae bacterium]
MHTGDPRWRRPILLVVHGRQRATDLDLGIGPWFVDLARGHGRFDVRIGDLDELARTIDATSGRAPASGRGRDAAPSWHRPVAEADAFAFATADAEEGLMAPLLDVVDRRDEAWRLKPAGLIRPPGAPFERSAHALREVLRTLRAVPVDADTNVPDAAHALRLGPTETEAAAAREAHALLGELARMHHWLRS